MQSFRLAKTFFMAIFALGGAVHAQQASTNRVAEMKDWSVFVDSNPKECWAVSKPKESVNKLNGRVVPAQRGEILLFVFYRPGEQIAGQIAFTGGYPFAKQRVEIDVDGSKFALATIDGQWAWAASGGDDSKILTALKRGAKATIKGKSTRGKTTIDTFSLQGLTAAADDAKKRCSS